MYLKIIFSKNSEQTTRQLKFKFDPVPTELTKNCLFDDTRMETFDTQIFGYLYIKYCLVFYKIIVIQFYNIFLVVASENNTFSALGK